MKPFRFALALAARLAAAAPPGPPAALAAPAAAGADAPVASASGAVKADGGKPPLGLIPRSALEAEARVLAFGARKYGRDNWRLGMEWSRHSDAALRHIAAFLDGEDADPESGLSHLAHAKCCLSFLIEYNARGLGKDDRPAGRQA